jgi:hypothetical protein
MCLPENKYQLVASALGTVFYMIAERWLGKTDKVAAGSVIELFEIIIKACVRTLASKLRGKNG